MRYENKKLIIGAGGSRGLGDILCLTPICKNLDTIVELHPDSAKYGILFNNLSNIRIVENPESVGDKPGILHSIEQKMANFLSLKDEPCLPFIQLTQPEIVQAEQKLKEIGNKIIAICPNSSLANRNNTQISFAIWENLVGILQSLGYTVLQFGTNDTMIQIRSTLAMRDLPIREIAAYFAVIGNVIVINTGLWHLAIAVRANTYLLHNNFHSQYWHYEKQHIKNEKIVIKYIHESNWKSLPGLIENK